jgi:uncharacterized protein (TIGR00255 family)
MAYLRSMTGYGKGGSQGKGISVEVEVKSVNHRFLEIAPRLPRFLTALESRIREKVREMCHRGKVDTLFTITPLEEGYLEVEVNRGKAQALWKAMEALARKLGREGELHLSHLLVHQDIFTIKEKERDPQTLWQVIETALDEALKGLIKEREREGETLKKDLLECLENMGHLLEEIAQRAPDLPQLYRAKLEKRLQELQVEVPPERLAQEVAIMADKTDITEELVRLETHLKELKKTLKEGSPCGKKMDFLAQESLRESNTIASKAQDAQIAHLVVAVKGEIEKVREQIQNIE